MKCTILGCGGSNGVPEIGCECVVCKSENPKNHRTRVSILVESDNAKILVDTSTDLRQQALNNKIKYVDAVLYTHDHADHVAGIDDIKLLSKDKKPIPAYMDERTHAFLMQRFPYIFKQFSPLYPPRLTSVIIKTDENFMVGDIRVQSFPQIHGGIHSLGFKFGNLTYSTDLNKIPELSYKLLEGTEVWILDCMRYYWMPSHAYLELILNWVARVKPKLTVLTHMAHTMEYDELKRILPKHIIPAYDGMVIDL
ncbi:Metal-dependent hydrolases of the beta-lactamase superfamily I [Candidatus Jidaibacter acanthamoeba]|uniref:Metal-dependent hydrolases of the beta-lactamase superfamily I n=1 Tax=Candidatus Jidaibacter acanthamoebae TaxID=86105 RepID=A0A0C1MRC6_9RICK|nr:MBL fold metallo-hydrolase [Candidatus Jidaibacter acanthamoeba]KIE04587.1 Metal-dependent hydrolases of the beta-lactamase superfamily I [Candidatus Jidaibacter acanthamoeba]